MKKAIATIVFSFLATPVLAQVPIDPLKLPDSEAGSYVYTLGIGYSPDGQQEEYIDFSGEPASFTYQEKQLNLSFSGSYSFSKNISIYGNIIPYLLIKEETQKFGDQSNTNTETETDISGDLSLEYHFAPNKVLDPRLAIGVSYPWGVNVQTSATLLKDPVILLGSLGYNRSLEFDEDAIAFGIGAGFIANEHINFSATASHIIPLEKASFSTTSLSFRTGYTLNQKSGSELGFKTILSVNGRDTRVGFSLEYGGRGRFGNIDKNSEIDNNENI